MDRFKRLWPYFLVGLLLGGCAGVFTQQELQDLRRAAPVQPEPTPAGVGVPAQR